MTLLDLTKSLKASKVLLIGDLILDEYRYGTALGLSAETPTVVGRDDSTTVSLGGAGLLCRNILALGGKVEFLSLLGDDDYQQYATRFRHRNLSKIFLSEPGRKTTVKSRFWVSGYKLLQWDRLDNRPIGPDLEKTIISTVKARLASFDKLVVSDYRHGLIPESLAHSLVSLAAKQRKPIYIDSQVSQQSGNHRWYTGATLFCLNKREAITVNADFGSHPLETALPALQKNLKAQTVVVKLGEKGCTALLGKRLVHALPPGVQTQDTTGAGDAFFAVLSLLPASLVESHLMLANTWAALSTTLRGAQPPDLSMLAEFLRKLTPQ